MSTIASEAAKARNILTPITVTVPKAAEISGLGQSTIWKYIAEGRLRTTTVGRRRLVIYESLEGFVMAGAAS